ncbi:response regulator [Lachnospiraceae bacterium OttesenSCG-928-D06]|nr:response regulator [Lachnospiraceae bacterium OttesenSCG-928-D06]
MRLLIVDDEIFAIDAIIDGVNWDALEYDEVLKAGSYRQAVDLFLKKSIDVVLCDIEMPGESGLELINWINEYHPNTECIILSCHDEFDFARQAVALKCLDYVLKPAKYDLLTEILKKAGEVVKEKARQTVLGDYGKVYIHNLSLGENQEEGDVIERITDYISHHIADELSVKSLANMVYMNGDHLTRLFRKRFNQTLTEYIMKKRMVMAGEILKEKGMTVTRASDLVGFTNYSYFTEQFKRYYGITPREYQYRERA